MSNIGTKLYTMFFCRYVGIDEFGNRYFLSRKKDASGKNVRSVVYNGLPEPTKIPPIWHAWLHYSGSDVPNIKTSNYFWQKKHLPNLTGTKFAYLPSGHVLKGGKRQKSSSDYQPWNPN